MSQSLFCRQFLGDLSEEDPPVPIPNTAVKLLSPDGTARASVWESRTSPGLLQQSPLITERALSFLLPSYAEFHLPDFPARAIFETRLTSFRESGRVLCEQPACVPPRLAPLSN
jgi:hypothetical protein